MPARSSARYLAGLDVGGTNVRFAVAAADEPARLLVRRAAPTPCGVPLPAFVDFLTDGLEDALAGAGLARTDLAGIGCAAPGITDADAGVIVLAANLDWRDVPLPRLLEARFGVPAVVENDVRAAAVAEYRHGAGRGRSSLVYFTVSTGVAAGIVVDGRPLRGFHHAAGEIGLLLPDRAHIGQDWGENGALELTSAGVGIARAWAARHGGPATPATAEAVFARARAGDAEADALVSRAADYLSQAVVAIGTIIDPEIVVLGGSIAQHQPRIAGRIREVARQTLLFPPEIAPAALEGDAPLIGALTLAAERSAADGRRATLSSRNAL